MLWDDGWAIQCSGLNSARKCQDIAEEIPSAQVVELKATEKEDVPIEWQNALTKADPYANRQHMSQSRLYNQLTSEYGEGFTEEAAQYAIENVKADWNANALEKARRYQERQAMSVDRIYRQLTSEYGEGFTPEQAQYAVDNL
ncbi:Ltp family lipoprotein [Corynebacterium glutamicum]|uniref:Ltp family lipoprotein n=1 Tax=Corynebacterium glutamicum TaxID=1718 RepID=UPI0009BD7D88